MQGHYARKDYRNPVSADDKSDASGSMLPRLLRHPSPKDQTYYLASIPRIALDRTIFPLGNTSNDGALSKGDVRALARKLGLHTAGREESMGICFVGEKRRFGDFVCMFSFFFYQYAHKIS